MCVAIIDSCLSHPGSQDPCMLVNVQARPTMLLKKNYPQVDCTATSNWFKLLFHHQKQSSYIMGSRQQALCRDGPKTRWRLQSIYQRLHSDIIAGEQMLASKTTQSSLQSLPQSAVAISMRSNYFKVANLKRELFIIFFQTAQRCNMIVLHLKQPPVTKEFSGVCISNLVLSVTATQLQRFSIVGAQCTSCWTQFIGACVWMTHQPQVHGQHRITKKQKQEN